MCVCVCLGLSDLYDSVTLLYGRLSAPSWPGRRAFIGKERGCGNNMADVAACSGYLGRFRGWRVIPDEVCGQRNTFWGASWSGFSMRFYLRPLPPRRVPVCRRGPFLYMTISWIRYNVECLTRGQPSFVAQFQIENKSTKSGTFRSRLRGVLSGCRRRLQGVGGMFVRPFLSLPDFVDDQA